MTTYSYYYDSSGIYTSTTASSSTTVNFSHDSPAWDLAISISGGTLTAKTTKSSSWVQYSSGMSEDTYSYYGYQTTVYVTIGSTTTTIWSWNGYGQSTTSPNGTGTIDISSATGTIKVGVTCTKDNCEWNGTILTLSVKYKAPSSYALTVTKITGKRISAKHAWTAGSISQSDYTVRYLNLDSNSSSGDNVKNGANGTTYTWTGLDNASSHTVYGKITDKSSGTTLSGSQAVTTYGCAIGTITVTTTTMTVPVCTTGHSYTEEIVVQLRTGSTSGTVAQTKYVSSASTSYQSVTFTGLSQGTTYYITIYESGVYYTNSDDETVYDAKASKSATTYTAPSNFSLTVTNITGKTITVKPTWTEGTGTSTVSVTVNSVSKTITNGSTATWTSSNGITNSTTYSISGALSNTTTNTSLSASTSATTYGVAVTTRTYTGNETRGQTIVFSIPSGAHSYSTSDGFYYAIYKGTSASGSPVTSGTSTSTTVNISQTFDPSTTYYVYVYLATISYDSTHDATASTTFTTAAAFSNVSGTLISTGRTITVTYTYSTGSTSAVTVKVSRNSGSTKYTATSGSGNSYTFESLSQGTSYTIYVYLEDAEGNTATWNGSVYTYSIIILTPSFSSTGTYRFDTEAIEFAAYIATGDSRKSSMTFNRSVTNGSGTISRSQSGISNATTESAAVKNTESGLYDNTAYTIQYDLEQMSDATKTAQVTTASLTVENVSYTYNQNSMTSTWQAYATSGSTKVAYDKTYVMNIAIVLSTSTSNELYCSCTPIATSGYQTNESTPTRSGEYTTLSYSNLTYYSYYTVVCAITDGTNYASASISDHTQFPYSYIYDGGWKKCMPYVYNGSKWILAPAYVYNGSGWKYCNGE